VSIHVLWMDTACRSQERAHFEVLNPYLVLLNSVVGENSLAA